MLSEVGPDREKEEGSFFQPALLTFRSLDFLGFDRGKIVDP